MYITTNVQAKKMQNDFINEYVYKASLVEQAFTADAAEVHIYIVRFTSGNTVTEANMVAHAAENNGHIDFIALMYHYGGVGVHAINAVQADNVLKYLFYSGEKKPNIWWDEF